MTITVEVISDRLEVSFSDLPRQVYRTDMATLITDAASEPFRRGDSDNFFAPPVRPTLTHLKGRPC